MNEKVGIKESKELVLGVLKVALVLVEQFKDGVQTSDFAVLFAKLAADEKVREAFKDLDKLPAEFKDLDLQEGFELGSEVVKFVPQILEAFKKKA